MLTYATFTYNKHFFLTIDTAQSARKIKPNMFSFKPFFPMEFYSLYRLFRCQFPK